MFKNKIKKQKKQYLIILSLGLVLILSGCFNKVVKDNKVATNTNTKKQSINSNDDNFDNNNDNDNDVENSADNEFDNKTEKDDDINTNKDNVDIDNGIKYDENGEIDTSDWLTYRNEELGVEFKYPKRYKKYIEYVIKFDKNDPINKGQSLLLYSKNGPIKFNFYSKNYISFGGNGLEYHGNKNLSNSCKNNLQISNNYESVVSVNSVGFCDNITIDKQNTFYDLKLAYLPECGGLSISQSVYLNLNNLKYSGLVISAELPHNLDNLYDCTSNTTRLEQQSRQYFQNIINKKQLDKNTKIEIDEFYKFLSTFKLINK